MDFPARIVVMGVTASGKTEVGTALGERLGYRFVDSDALHPKSNIEKMKRGEPLDDDDRAPWLDRVGETLAEANGEGGTIVACSALKRAYRDRIRRAAPDAVFVLLHADRHVLKERIESRPHHFMPPSLLDSQLNTLEQPGEDEPVVSVGVQVPMETVVQRTIARLGALKSERAG